MRIFFQFIFIFYLENSSANTTTLSCRESFAGKNEATLKRCNFKYDTAESVSPPLVNEHTSFLRFATNTHTLHTHNAQEISEKPTERVLQNGRKNVPKQIARDPFSSVYTRR